MLETIPVVNINDAQRNNFDCGEHFFNNFLWRHATDNHSKGIGKTFVLVLNDKVAGYYTVSMSNSVEFKDITEYRLPRYPMPVGLIGMLAVSKENQRQGLGKWLLIDALHKIYKASEYVGTFAAIVDAVDEKAKSFYLYYGFVPFPNKPLTLYMPLASILTLIETGISVTMK
jgi:GNAT superfamily N-acetyltransferase